VLEFEKDQQNVAPDVKLINSVVIQPSMILPGTVITNSIVGPHVTIGKKCVISQYQLFPTPLFKIIQKLKMRILPTVCSEVMPHYTGSVKDLSIGDYNEIKE
jgi:glucose-1-phosphate thymidylyltransferase